MRKKILLALSIIICLIIAIGIYFYSTINGNCIAKEGSIYIPRDASYQTLIDSLQTDGGHIDNIDRFHSTAKLLGAEGSIKEGHYSLRKGMSYREVIRMFQRGYQTPIRLTFNNIRTLPQLAGRIAQQIEADSLSLIQTFSADTTASHYGFSSQRFIAMFIPNTYEVYWTISPVGVLDRMKREYDLFWSDEREAKLRETGLTRDDAITLASIVYEETKMSDEMPTVAGVYLNRLRINMLLQADPTVKFAVGDFTLRRILYKHLDVVSPYNTYMYKGLPPGPICMPSTKAIDAVLNYQRHKYLFFCAKEDFSGYHNFAVTLAEHNRNKQAWTSALDRAGIR